jgi:hypothetical protein
MAKFEWTLLLFCPLVAYKSLGKKAYFLLCLIAQATSAA